VVGISAQSFGLCRAAQYGAATAVSLLYGALCAR
jgi:hypothetical protein